MSAAAGTECGLVRKELILVEMSGDNVGRQAVTRRGGIGPR